MRKPAGELIYDIITRENISQSALCRGLCSTSAFSRYLKGERSFDRLLFTVILQRLGKSPDKFITVLTDEEYNYFEWKQDIYQAQLKHNWQKVYMLLQEKQAKNRSCNALLQKQYYILMQGIIQENLFHNRMESVRLIGEAIALTVPEFYFQEERELLHPKQLLGEQEIQAILLWQRLQSEKNKSFEILHFLIQYIEMHYMDEQERVKLYPQIAAQYLEFLYQKGSYHECMSVSEKAVEMMVSSGYAFCVEAILAVQVRAAEKLGFMEQMNKRRVQLSVWKEVLQEDRKEHAGEEGLLLLDICQEAELLRETLSLCRQERGYSQETLSEGICAPETISRIENGKRLPRRKTYQALKERLSLQRDFFYSDIETDDFRVLEDKWQLEKFFVMSKWTEAGIALDRLVEKLDMTVNRNVQYYEFSKYGIECGLKAERKNFFELIRILGYTVKAVPQKLDVKEWPDSFWIHTFTNMEMIILMQISDSMAAVGKWEEATILLEKMLNHYSKSRIALEFHYRIVNLIMGRLSSYYGMLKKTDKELFFSEKGIELLLQCKAQRELPRFINNKADALENQGENKRASKYYRQAFYLAEFMHLSTAELARQSYEKLTHLKLDY